MLAHNLLENINLTNARVLNKKRLALFNKFIEVSIFQLKHKNQKYNRLFQSNIQSVFITV